MRCDRGEDCGRCAHYKETPIEPKRHKMKAGRCLVLNEAEGPDRAPTPEEQIGLLRMEVMALEARMDRFEDNFEKGMMDRLFGDGAEKGGK